jgi:hypothetical protein
MKLLILLASLASLFLFIEFFNSKKATRSKFDVGGKSITGSNVTVAGRHKVINPETSAYTPIYSYIRER